MEVPPHWARLGDRSDCESPRERWGPADLDPCSNDVGALVLRLRQLRPRHRTGSPHRAAVREPSRRRLDRLRHPRRHRRRCGRLRPGGGAPDPALGQAGPVTGAEGMGCATGQLESGPNAGAVGTPGAGECSDVGHVDVAGVRYELPDGRVLLDDVSFRVGEGAKVALVGANGAGKTTLLRIITGDLAPHAGAVTRTGGLGVMRQMVGARARRATPTVADLLLSVSPAAGPRGRRRGRPLRARADGDRRREDPDAVRRGAGGVRRRRRLRHRGDLGRLHGRRARACPTTGRSTASCAPCPAASRSGWCWSSCSAAPTRCCCSTSRTTSSTSPARSGSSSGSASPTRRSCSSATTASCSTTPRPGWSPSSSGAAPATCVWTHPGGFASYHEARKDRFLRFEELRRRWDEEHAKIKALVLRLKIKAEYNDGMASQYQAAQTRLRKFEEAGPPTEQPREQQVHDAAQGRPHRQARGGLRRPRADRADEAVRPRGLVRRAGGRARLQRLRASRTSCGCWPPAAATPTSSTGRSSDVADQAGAPHRQGQARRPGAAGLVRADPRAPRAGRPHAARDPAPRRRPARRPSRAWAASRPPGCWTATSSRTPRSRSSSRSAAASRRGSRSCCSSCPARPCCCSTSRPTTSTCSPPRRWRTGLEAFDGTVIAVTHDRWFARGFDRFLVYGADGDVYESRRAGLGRGPGGARAMSALDDHRPRPVRRAAFDAWHAVYDAAQPATGRGERRPPGARGAARRDAGARTARPFRTRLRRSVDGQRRRRRAGRGLPARQPRPAPQLAVSTRPDHRGHGLRPPRCSPTSRRSPASAAGRRLVGEVDLAVRRGPRAATGSPGVRVRPRARLRDRRSVEVQRRLDAAGRRTRSLDRAGRRGGGEPRRLHAAVLRRARCPTSWSRAGRG